ncbi:hypothetical protein [Alkalicoccus urumqiensis]|uniref:hypothetical protein n=1 Tax=Alkalicoccus urumqiensis TaxID=1548213 RepID=UPI00115A000B|nr:hypothetical protein [Alkalicoccus urumqiensis]
MKQFIPFIIIAAVIGAALFLFQDEYEGPFRPDYSSSASNSFWDASLYVMEEGGEYEIGLRLEASDEIDVEEIEAVEFFVDSSAVSFYFQDLETESFDGVIDYSEPCSVCSQTNHIEARALVNWRAETTNTSQFQFSLDLDEE